MSKNEKCTYKACETIVFHCQIGKFASFLACCPRRGGGFELPIIEQTKGNIESIC